VNQNIILGGFLLPFRLFFTPKQFVDEVCSFSDGLSYFYGIIEMRKKILREPPFRRGLLRLFLQVLIAMPLWACLSLTILLPFELIGDPIKWHLLFPAHTNLVLTAIIIIALFATFIGLMFLFGMGLFGSVALSVVWAIDTSLVAGLGLILGLVVETEIIGDYTWALAWGSLLGIVLGIFLLGVLWDGLKDADADVGFALFLIVIPVFLYITYRSFPSEMWYYVVGFFTAAFWLARIPNLILHIPLMLLWLAMARQRPNWTPHLWRICLVHWDEIIIIPLPGLASFLTLYYEQYPAMGKEAIKAIAAHPSQFRVASKALTAIVKKQAQSVNTLRGMSFLKREIDDARNNGVIIEPTTRQVYDICTEIDSGKKSDSATNTYRRYCDGKEILNQLSAQPGTFLSILPTWEKLLEKEIEKAETQAKEEEPIPQVFAKDGKARSRNATGHQVAPFKGRKTLFRTLEQGLGGKHQGTYLLVGPHRFGKTSILYELPNRLGSKIIPVFIDLQSVDLHTRECNDAIAKLLSHIGTIIREKIVNRDGEIVLSLPQEQFLAPDPVVRFQTWLNGVEKAISGNTLLLCLDEFDKLEDAIRGNILDTRILWVFRRILHHHRHIVLLFSGVRQSDELSDYWAEHIFANGITLPVSFLEEQDARDLITNPVPDFPSIYTPDAVDEIIRLSHCHPRLIHLICAHVVDRMNDTKRTPESPLTPDDVTAIIPTIFQQNSGDFDDIWNRYTNDIGRQVLRLIANAADGIQSYEDLKSAVVEEKALREAIKLMRRRELITPAPHNCYRITIPLMQLYIQQRIQEC
jgi:hypothetical protein